MKKFVTDKPLCAKVQSTYRTFELFALQSKDRLTEEPIMFKRLLQEAQMEKDSLERVHKITGCNTKYDIVRCLVTITHREIEDDAYHYTDHLKEVEEYRKL